ncbi:hypothetical protein D6D28_06052 [Aureobasidium pullulans]|uniref:Uncharacterized protein n=1 Tax=Aureobasidium pullulans TaxID=5580 RepID=A0A4V4HZL0_AURPU|nr:hypothetical protein D6D28_06052 [Aureobasidium pullulans]
MPPKRAATKRQYSAIDIDSDADSSASESTSRAAPKRKAPVKKTTTSTTTLTPAKKAAATKSSTVAKTYKDAIKALATALKSLDAKVRKMPPNSRAITTNTYADMASKHLKAVNALEKMDKGLVYAFNMAMAVADASHTDCDTTPKMGGFGDSEGPFGEMDGTLVGLIERRNGEGSAKRQEGLPTVRKRWTRADGDVGEFKTGRPNKQQYGQLQRQKLAWENERREEKRERRESVDDWVTVALQDLKEERDYLAEYGVEKYFPKSIARLEKLLGSEPDAAAGAGDAA